MVAYMSFISGESSVLPKPYGQKISSLMNKSVFFI